MQTALAVTIDRQELWDEFDLEGAINFSRAGERLASRAAEDEQQLKGAIRRIRVRIKGRDQTLCNCPACIYRDVNRANAWLDRAEAWGAFLNKPEAARVRYTAIKDEITGRLTIAAFNQEGEATKASRIRPESRGLDPNLPI